MLMSHFKNLLYSLVIFGVSSAYCGSYEDFFVALSNDNAASVSNLLQRGFDPNTPDPKGQPGLTMAMQQGSLNAARALLAHPDIKVDALNQAGESALMMAALKGNLVGVELLLERGAKVQQTGWAAIHYAATGPEPKLVGLLLDRGAAIDAEAPNGNTPLMMAARYGSEDGVNLLLARGADPKLRNQRGMSASDLARLAGREPLARQLEALMR